MSLFSDPRWGEALGHLPDYLGNHVRVSVTALALGLLVSLPLAILSRHRPVLRGALLGLASIVQTVPGLALLALFYPLLLALAALSLSWFGAGFSAFGFLPAVLALALYSMLPVLRNTITGLARRRSRDPGSRAGRRHDAAAIAVHGRVAAGAAGDDGGHPHRGGLGDRHRDLVDADRPDQPRQLHLCRSADPELGVRAVRLPRSRRAGARRRSVAGADRRGLAAAQPLPHGARRRRALPRWSRPRWCRP